MNNVAESLHRRAIKAMNRGDIRNLKILSQQILAQNQEDAEAWFFLSIVGSATGRFADAVNAVDNALLFDDSENVEYLCQKARYHSVLNEYQAAATSADLASDLLGKQTRPRALLHDTLGVVFTRIGQFDKAYTQLEKAVLIEPKNAQFQFNLASALQFVGKAETARRHFLRAIELKPNFYRAYWSLSELEKEKAPSKFISQLRSELSKTGLTAEDQLYLSHALARECEKRGDYREAFELLKHAKHHRSKQLNYRFDDDKSIFQTLHTTFTNKQLSAPVDEAGQGCVFIVGMPRSGTTLVERILSSHHSVISLGELQNFALAVRSESDSKSKKVFDPDVVGSTNMERMSAVGERYLKSLGDRRPASGIFIDKMPLNFLYIGFILAALPAAKIICVHRNPLDTCLSNYRQLFAMGFSYYNYNQRLEDVARYYVEFARLMSHWRELYGERICSVQYESLVDQPEPEAKNLLTYLNLSWDENCLNFHKNTTAVATASAMQVREKIYARAVNRWKKYEAMLGPAKKILDDNGICYL